MKHLFILILACLSFAANAQSKRAHRIDSLRNALLTAKEDTEKVEILIKLGHNLRFSKPDETIKYATEATELAQTLDDQKGLANAYNELGNIYNTQGKYFKALKKHNHALKIRKTIGDKQGEGGSLCNIGLVYRNIGRYKKAMEYYNNAKAILQEIDYKPFLAQTIINIAALDMKKEDYTNAVDCYKQAFDLYKALYNNKGMANASNGLSWAHFERHEYDDAGTFAIQGLAFANEAKYTAGIKYANNMLDKIHAITKK